MTDLEITIWKFVRQDMPAAEFEQWVYTQPELEEFWGKEFYLGVISSGFVQERHLYELRESLRAWMMAHTTPSCECVTLESRINLMEVLWEQAYLSDNFAVLLQRGDYHQLLACRHCGQHWYLGIDRFEGEYHLLRLDSERVTGIRNEGRWPMDFDNPTPDLENFYLPLENADTPVRAETKSYHSILQRLRVPLGFLTAIVFLRFSTPSWRTLAVGVPIALCGLAIRAWASGHLRKNAELAVSGPYAYTRNPLYFGSFILALGVAVCGGSWWLAILLLGFFLAVYLPVMQAEAAHMHELFPRDFAEYEKNVPLFLPRLTPWKRGATARFDQRLYLKYREYRALIGLVVVVGILVLRVVLQ